MEDAASFVRGRTGLNLLEGLWRVDHCYGLVFDDENPTIGWRASFTRDGDEPIMVGFPSWESRENTVNAAMALCSELQVSSSPPLFFSFFVSWVLLILPDNTRSGSAHLERFALVKRHVSLDFLLIAGSTFLVFFRKINCARAYPLCVDSFTTSL